MDRVETERLLEMLEDRDAAMETPDGEVADQAEVPTMEPRFELDPIEAVERERDEVDTGGGAEASQSDDVKDGVRVIGGIVNVELLSLDAFDEGSEAEEENDDGTETGRADFDGEDEDPAVDDDERVRKFLRALPGETLFFGGVVEGLLMAGFMANEGWLMDIPARDETSEAKPEDPCRSIGTLVSNTADDRFPAPPFSSEEDPDPEEAAEYTESTENLFTFGAGDDVDILELDLDRAGVPAVVSEATEATETGREEGGD
ncbi:hypothetical protein HDU97_001587 [Phlyctochytrium planicorne]|nr:hypothetical protein HDU97_001587 [Phlyctochytrium planicorne]